MPIAGHEGTLYRNRKRQLIKSEENEIAPIPPVFDPMRRARCEADPATWLRTYLPGVFSCQFSKSQIDFIDACWEAILNRGNKNINAYRGFGKTSILAGLLLMSHLTGHTRHALFITAEGTHSTAAASAFFAAALYEEYDRPQELCKPIAQDYPEVYYPIQKRKGIAQKPLKYHGEPTDIKISPSEIVFPSIAGSPSNGSIIRFTSIGSSSIRGSHRSIRGEGEKRVDIVLMDDVQSDGTAKSEKEVGNIMDTIKTTIRMLAGRSASGGKESLIILSALTQNQNDDVAVRIIDEHPEFCTSIIRFLKKTPIEFKRWAEYRDRRNEIYRKNAENITQARRLICDYYREHRDEIENGVEVDNPQLKEDWQESAVHYALDIWASSLKGFWCELQNDSIRAAQETEEGLVPVVVQRKRRQNTDGLNLRRCWIPDGADILTAFVDCGEHYLNYQVTAFSKDFTLSHVVDFGVMPEQPCPVSKKTYVVDLQTFFQDGDRFDRLTDAILSTLNRIFNQQYFDCYGRPLRPEEIHRETDLLQNARPRGEGRRFFRFLSLCGVDAGDGEMETAVWRAVDEFNKRDGGAFFGRAIPTYGHSAEARLMRYWPLKPGEFRRGGDNGGGCDWVENPKRCQQIRTRFPTVHAALIYDSNTAKTRLNTAWQTPEDVPGACTLFDDADTELLRDFSEQQCSETFKEGFKSNLLYKTWVEKKPHFADNEYLDTGAGCFALANYVGCELKAIQAPIRRRSPKVSREQAYAIAQARMNR